MLADMTYQTFVERYRDKSYIGSGGFAKVYKVFDYANQKYVALKVADVRPEFKKFTLQNEVELVNQLPTHNNVIRYDACYRFNTGISGEMDFAVLPYYELGNLEQFLNKNQLSKAEVDQLVIGILKGVRFLHQNHCIHRDLKAQNILIHRDYGVWIPKIADFGLSRYVKKDDLAVSNSSIGLTFEYASPEQIKNQKIYKNVDLWAVGVLIYRIVAGTSPFRAPQGSDPKSAQTQLEISNKIVNLQLPQTFYSLPQPYQSIISKCLVIDPQQRVQDADELLAMMQSQQSEDLPQSIPESDIYDSSTKRINPPSVSAAPTLMREESPNPPPQSVPPAQPQQRPTPPPAPRPPAPSPPVRRSTPPLPSAQPKQAYQQRYRPPVSPPPMAPAPRVEASYEPPVSASQQYEPPVDQPQNILNRSHQAPQTNPSMERPTTTKSPSEPISKFWIYLPLYLLLLSFSVWALYTLMSTTNSSEPLPPPPPEETPLSIFMTCFDENKNALGGTFQLIPTAELETCFKKLEQLCYNKLCDEVETVYDGKGNKAYFYDQAERGNSCFKPVLDATVDYHHAQLEQLPLLALFYNSGKSKLTDPQQNELTGFVKSYKRNAEKYGLLLIGRASNKGNASANKKLSLKRVETIKTFLENQDIKNLKTEFVYFGADPPQLNRRLAKRYGIQRSEYKNITYGAGNDSNYSLRLNQSVILVIYERDKDPFGLEKN